VYGEFFIEEHSEMQKENLQEDYNDAYWEQRYTLKTQNLPQFLAKVNQRIVIIIMEKALLTMFASTV
jgi:gamma-tubulin complex component 2